MEPIVKDLERSQCFLLKMLFCSKDSEVYNLCQEDILFRVSQR